MAKNTSSTSTSSIPTKESNQKGSYASLPKIFALPPPIKYLFNSVPLKTYPSNALPARSPQLHSKTSSSFSSSSPKHRLFLFSTAEDAVKGRPSFNPTCLKWQTFLAFAGIEVELVVSNNHASPSGVLPFLISHSANSGDEMREREKEKTQASNSNSSADYNVITGGKGFRKFVKEAGRTVGDLDGVARHLPRELYINPSTSSYLARHSLSRTLNSAAEAELISSSATSSSLSIFSGYSYQSKIDAGNLYKEAQKAFEALDTLLGDKEWFFGNSVPSEFDAAVFAYTHLLLDRGMGWRDRRLVEIVEGCENLVGHRERIVEGYYGGELIM